MQSTESILSECERLAGESVTIRPLGSGVLAMVGSGHYVTAAHGDTAETALVELRNLLGGGLQATASPRSAVGEIGMWH